MKNDIDFSETSAENQFFSSNFSLKMVNFVNSNFRLIAELVSVRLNCGATHEEAIR